MNGLLEALNQLKFVSTYDELSRFLVSSGFKVNDTEWRRESDDSYRCYRLAHEIVPQLPHHKNQPGNIVEADIFLKSSIFSLALAFGRNRTQSLITKSAASLIRSTKLMERVTPDFCREHFSTPVFIYTPETHQLLEDLCGIAAHVDQDGFLQVIIALTNKLTFATHFKLDDPEVILSRKDSSYGKVENNEATNLLLERNEPTSTSNLMESFYDAIEYLAKFVLLLKCEKRPVYLHPQTSKGSKNPAIRFKHEGYVNAQTVSLTKEYVRDYSSRELEEHSVLDKEGKVLKAIVVTGHIRMQAYGPGRTLRRPVYIAEHQSSAWVNDGVRVLRIVK